MQYTHLGRTGLGVSRLCLGTWNFGLVTEQPEAHAIMDRALEQGINYFDTADCYPTEKTTGTTEEIIGRWFAQGGGRRERTVIATKVLGPMGEWPQWPNMSGLSALHIKQACEGSLRRLKTDHIDIYQMHHVMRETPWEEIWQAMEQLVREGKVVYIGSSNFAGWHIAKANEAAKARHFMGLVSEQCKYNLLTRTAELELLPACADYGLGVIPWSPLGGGALGGALKKAKEGRRVHGETLVTIENNLEKLERYESFCDEIGENPAHVGLAWLLANPVVTAPIIGPRTVAQVDDSVAALETKLSPETMAKLDEIFPGPGGVAPEAWAW